MKRVILAVTLGFCALFARAPAALAGTVGVVVTGEPSMQPALVAQLEGWLGGHGHKVVPRPLDTAATNRLIDCFTVDDSSCGRKVVEKSASSDSVVFARVTREGQTLSLSIYWIVKGKPASGSRRGCEECTEGALRGAADEIMDGLSSAAASATGRLKLTSKPEGLIVMVDNVKIGVTPLERDFATGSHSITLVDGTTRVGERSVQIPMGATVELTMTAEYPPDDPRRPPPPPPRPSYALPIILLAAGGLMIAGGGVELYLGQQGGPDHPEDKYNYPGATPAGIALVSAGAVAIGVGIWQLRRVSRESRPVAMLSPHGSYFGWQGSF